MMLCAKIALKENILMSPDMLTPEQIAVLAGFKLLPIDALSYDDDDYEIVKFLVAYGFLDATKASGALLHVSITQLGLSALRYKHQLDKDAKLNRVLAVVALLLAAGSLIWNVMRDLIL
jgi:hypothetical protein